jgi:ABC-type glutathione transport system ATPase component
MLNIKIKTNPYDRKIYKKASCIIEPGISVLVGRNGVGKTTFLRMVKEQCEKNKIKTFCYDNFREGGDRATQRYGYDENISALASTLFISEGEQIFYNLGEKIGGIGKFVKANANEKTIVILLDALDSGLDCEGIEQIKRVFSFIVNDFSGELYILMPANNYGLVEGSKCFDVQNCEYVDLKDYTGFKEFILNQYIQEIKEEK